MMAQSDKARPCIGWKVPRIKPLAGRARLGFGFRFGLGLVLALSILILAYGLIGQVSAIQGEQSTLLAAQRETLPGLGLKAPLDLATIPGFRKRGMVFVGEVQGGNGTLLRLVFDSKSNALIGMHVVGPSAQADPRPVLDPHISSHQPLPAATTLARD
jgi:hypothetical protein